MLRRARGSKASMRPGRIRPGEQVPACTAVHECRDASMRPGRIRPGEPGPSRTSRTRLPGFNEAGANPPRRGRPSTGPSREPRPRFNEAGANPPRRAGGPVRGGPVWWGFNEAGANPPRRGRGVGTWAVRRELASMRPGRIRPGEMARHRTMPAHSICFNEAGANPPRRDPFAASLDRRWR